MTFYERLQAVYEEIGPLCAGIDPHPKLLLEWDLPVNHTGLENFVAKCLEAFLPTVGIVKPQVALFEAFGSLGYRVLETAIQALKDAGIIVIADAKRGDIGTTMDGYARAWLDTQYSDLASDAVTVSPFLGVSSLSGAIDVAIKNDAGIFVLAKTSNPEGNRIQNALISPDLSVSQSIVDDIGHMNAQYLDPVLGIVVGAPQPHGLVLDNFRGPILVPGLGFQGGKIEQVTKYFSTEHGKRLIIPSISRSILASGPSVPVIASTTMGYNRELRSILGR